MDSILGTVEIKKVCFLGITYEAKDFQAHFTISIIPR